MDLESRLSVRELMSRSLHIIKSELDVSKDPSSVFRTRIRSMAERGDLALLAIMFDRLSTAVSRDLLDGPLPPEKRDDALGRISALRLLFADIVDAGELPGQAKEPDIRENNPFSIITSDDEPFSILP